MPLLSRKADYALLILSHLYHHSNGASAREIAERFSLSKPFVANILKELCQKGYVVSHRGVKGGYVLARPVGQIRLTELLNSLEDEFQLTACTPGDAHHEGCDLMHVCPIRSPIHEIHRRITEVLSRITLAEVFQAHDPGLPLPILTPLPLREPTHPLPAVPLSRTAE